MTTGAGIRLGRVAGTPVLLRPSWFLIAALVAVAYAPTVEPRGTGLTVRALAVGLAFAVVLLLSVLLHELAHALAARRAGSPPTRIVLDVWGGHTAMSSEATTPGRSLAVAVVGPLTNAVLAALVWWAARQLDATTTTGELLRATAVANLLVAVLNALPGLPLDGGRILEALVWRVTGERTRGTTAAAWCGRAVAVLVAVVAVVPPLLRGERPPVVAALWLLLVAALLWQGATQSLRLARWQRLAPTVSATGLQRPAVGVPSTASLAAARLAAGDRQIVVLDLYGKPAALLDERAAASVPPVRAGEVPASAVSHALPHEAVVPADLTGVALLEQLESAPADRYVVVDGDGTVVGVLDWDDVATAVGAR